MHFLACFFVMGSKQALFSLNISENPGQATTAAMQCLSKFGLYHDLYRDLQMTSREV